MNPDTALEDQVREALSAHVEPPGDRDCALVLKSLELVMLAEDLERRFGFLVAARELVPANFGSLARLIAYVAQRTGEGGR